jgi:hypothetical protein
MTKVALCVPINGPPSWLFFDSMMQWQAWHCANHPDVTVTQVRPPRPLPVDVARNYLARKVLVMGDYDYLWFIDQDCAFLPRTLERLMSWHKPVVGCLTMIRSTECALPMAFMEANGIGKERRVAAAEVYEYIAAHYDCETNAPQILDPVPDNSLLEVQVTGCHNLLIEPWVLYKLREPWFQGNPGQEDWYFCTKAASMDIPVYVDLSVLAGHGAGADRSIGAFDFMAGFRFQSEVEAAKEKEKHGTGSMLPGIVSSDTDLHESRG